MMAKDKSKDEIKADIVDQEAEVATTGKASKGAGAAKGKSRNTKKNPEPAATTSKKLAESKNEPDSGTEAVAKELKKGKDNGHIEESDQTTPETDSQRQEVEPGEAPATGVKSTAKAGKRSAKALKEADEKVAKEARKSTQTEEGDKKPAKAAPKPPRPRIERRGKGYRKSHELIDKNKTYNIADGVSLVVKTSHVKFDATVELHVRLGIDPRQADQNLRDTVVLPAGTGKDLRVAVFAEPEAVAAAKKAGADIAAHEEFLQQLDKEQLDFDVLIATPSMMPMLGKYARLLGPKGLMPNPKSGTVTTDVTKAVSEAKAGKVEYRVDSTGIVHVGIGKVSFGPEKLLENARAILGSIKTNKPSSLKGNYVRSVYLTSSMGPSITIDNSEV